MIVGGENSLNVLILQDNDDPRDQDYSMEDSFESSSQLVDDSITGMVDSMLEAARPHTPPRPEDEDDVQLLPPSPSPAKPPRPPRQASPAILREGSSTHSLRKFISFVPAPSSSVICSIISLLPHVIQSHADHSIQSPSPKTHNRKSRTKALLQV